MPWITLNFEMSEQELDKIRQRLRDIKGGAKISPTITFTGDEVDLLETILSEAAQNKRRPVQLPHYKQIGPELRVYGDGHVEHGCMKWIADDD